MATTIRAEDNFCGMDLLHPPSTATVRVVEVPIVRATFETVQATGIGRIEPSFEAAMCDITPWPTAGWRKLQAGTGIEGGTVQDVFRMSRRGCVQYATNVAIDRSYITGWYSADPATACACTCAADCTCECSGTGTHTDRPFILTHEANYHPDGGQIFAAREGKPFVLLLARPRICGCTTPFCCCPRATLDRCDDVRPSDFAAFWCENVAVHVNAGTWHQPAFPVQDGTVFDNSQGKVHACIAVDFVTEFGCYMKVPLRAPTA